MKQQRVLLHLADPINEANREFCMVAKRSCRAREQLGGDTTELHRDLEKTKRYYAKQVAIHEQIWGKRP